MTKVEGFESLGEQYVAQEKSKRTAFMHTFWYNVITLVGLRYFTWECLYCRQRIRSQLDARMSYDIKGYDMLHAYGLPRVLGS